MNDYRPLFYYDGEEIKVIEMELREMDKQSPLIRIVMEEDNGDNVILKGYLVSTKHYDARMRFNIKSERPENF